MLFLMALAGVCACVCLALLPQTTGTSPSRAPDSFAFSQAESSHGRNCCRLAVHLRASRHLFTFAFQTRECCCRDYPFFSKDHRSSRSGVLIGGSENHTHIFGE